MTSFSCTGSVLMVLEERKNNKVKVILKFSIKIHGEA